jgi:hypothetical protein
MNKCVTCTQGRDSYNKIITNFKSHTHSLTHTRTSARPKTRVSSIYLLRQIVRYVVRVEVEACRVLLLFLPAVDCEAGRGGPVCVSSVYVCVCVREREASIHLVCVCVK